MENARDKKNLPRKEQLIGTGRYELFSPPPLIMKHCRSHPNKFVNHFTHIYTHSHTHTHKCETSGEWDYNAPNQIRVILSALHLYPHTTRSHTAWGAVLLRSVGLVLGLGFQICMFERRIWVSAHLHLWFPLPRSIQGCLVERWCWALAPLSDSQGLGLLGYYIYIVVRF